MTTGWLLRALVLVLFLGTTEDDWRVAVPDYDWSFPEDHWAHEGYRTEWWYLTGQLAVEGADAPRFGYQFTFFRIGVLPEPVELDSAWAANAVIMGHAAVSDLETGQHVFTETLYRETPLLAQFSDYPEPRIGWSRGPAGTDGLWTLDWNGEAFDVSAEDDRLGVGFRLSTRPRKPLVFQGPNGFSRKGDGPGAASQYYSFTRLATSGELWLDGTTYQVSGASWMDKEFSSSQLEENQVGWDWFSLQLDDGREVMLYVMRDRSGSIDYASGTVVSADGAARFLGRDDFRVTAVDEWYSPATEARYPVRWRVQLASEELELEVRARFEDQENRSSLPGGVYYWEGAVTVEGDDGARLGKGFVELTGYGAGSRPPV